MTETHDLRNQWYDEPVRYETPMTKNEEEIEKVKEEIKVLEKKLSFLEELEKTKSPVEEAYKDWWGVYPETETWDSFDKTRWQGFRVGYEVAFAISTALKKEKVKKSKINNLAEKLLPDDHPYKIADEHGETNPLNSVDDEKKMEELGFVKNSDGNWMAQPLNWVKPQTPEQVADGLKEAFREAINQGVIPPVEIKQKTLTNLIERWWCDVFTTHSDWDMETSIDDLVDRIELFLPKEQIANSQNTYVELTVEGFNDAIKQIKSKLR